MTRAEANQLLDMARAGLRLPEEVITWALSVTGDAPDADLSERQEVLDFVQALRLEGLL